MPLAPLLYGMTLAVLALLPACKGGDEKRSLGSLPPQASGAGYASFEPLGELALDAGSGAFGSAADASLLYWQDGVTRALALSEAKLGLKGEWAGGASARSVVAAGALRIPFEAQSEWLVDESGVTLARASASENGARSQRKLAVRVPAGQGKSPRLLGFAPNWVALLGQDAGITVYEAARSADHTYQIPASLLGGTPIGAALLSGSDGRTQILVATHSALLSFHGTRASKSWKKSIAELRLPFPLEEGLVGSILLPPAQVPTSAASAAEVFPEALGLLVRRGKAFSFSVLAGEADALFPAASVPGEGIKVTWGDVEGVVAARCVSCHAPGSAFQAGLASSWNAPSGRLRAHVKERTMPPPGAPRPSASQWAILDAWLKEHP